MVTSSGSSRCETPTAQQLAITEVSTGIFAFDAAALWPALERLDPDNAQGELYLTDVIEILRGDGGDVIAHTHADPTIAVGVNNRADLAEAAPAAARAHQPSAHAGRA